MITIEWLEERQHWQRVFLPARFLDRVASVLGADRGRLAAAPATSASEKAEEAANRSAQRKFDGLAQGKVDPPRCGKRAARRGRVRRLERCGTERRSVSAATRSSTSAGRRAFGSAREAEHKGFVELREISSTISPAEFSEATRSA
jgi:hypothetical protein